MVEEQTAMHVFKYEEHFGNKRATLVEDEGSSKLNKARLLAKQIARDRVVRATPDTPEYGPGQLVEVLVSAAFLRRYFERAQHDQLLEAERRRAWLACRAM